MKNLFAVNLTDEDNVVAPADGYVCRRTGEELAQKMEAHSDEMTEEVGKATRSWPHFIGMGAAVVAGFVCVTVWDALVEEAESFAAAPVATWLWLAGALAAVAAFILVGRSYSKLVTARLETDEMQTAADQAEDYFRLSRIEMGVPADAARIDVLSYSYVVKKGKEKPQRISNEHYTAVELDVFVEEGNLMLADASVLYALPLSAVTGVRKIEGGTRVYCWNKEEQPKEEPYKPYRIRYDDEEDVFTLRAVYAVEWAGEDVELLVPDYEWERVVQPLTGLSVTSTDKTVAFSFG